MPIASLIIGAIAACAAFWLAWNFLIAGGLASVAAVIAALVVFGGDPSKPLMALLAGAAAFLLVAFVRGWSLR